ncbi:unnamed protein product [Symbiodinium natans]|uniref:EF-hand domain-containing protein n=1 Tax=Symbiodinium natans TaxID=878477 RepID=A0A812L3Z2_9DINO|nr:unnamed protein product [Symbiodinium natans]
MATKHDPSESARAELAVALASRRRTARSAFAVAGEAARRGEALGQRLCVALARACAEEGRADEAKLLRRRMMAAGIVPDAGIRADLVRAFGAAAATARGGERTRLLSHAWREVQEAKAQVPQSLPAELLHALLAAYCSADLAGHAKEVLMMSPSHFGVEPDEVAYAIVLSALEATSPTEFRQLWFHMRNMSERPGEVLLQSALRVAVKLQDMAFAQSVLELLFQAKVAPDAAVMSALGASTGPEAAALRRLLAAFGKVARPALTISRQRADNAVPRKIAAIGFRICPSWYRPGSTSDKVPVVALTGLSAIHYLALFAGEVVEISTCFLHQLRLFGVPDVMPRRKTAERAVNVSSFVQEEPGLVALLQGSLRKHLKDEAQKQKWKEMMEQAGLSSRSASSHEAPEEGEGEEETTKSRLQRSGTGWASIPRRERQEQARLRALSGHRCLQSRLLAANVLESEAFDFVMIIIILANAVTIGVEQWIRVEGGNTKDGPLNILEHIFLVIYTLEIFLRFFVNGPLKAIRDHWVKFDTVLVILGWLVLWILPAAIPMSEETGEYSGFLTLRTLRLLRLARTARIITRMHELWMLVQMVTSCASTMIYTLLLLVTVLYLFSLLFVEVITNHPLAKSEGVDPLESAFFLVANEHFANLWVTMMTLVQFVTLDSMANVYKPLVKGDPGLALYFGGLVLVISIVLMNLITAVIVNSALEQASSNKEIQRIQENKRRKKTIDELHSMFSRLDHDGSGTITLAEIMEATEEDQMLLKKFLTLESPLEIFRMLDIDNSGQLNIEEFCEGVIQHVTSDRSVEFKRIDKNFKQLRKEVRALQLSVDKLTGMFMQTMGVGSTSSMALCNVSSDVKDARTKRRGICFEEDTKPREPVMEPEPRGAAESQTPPVWAADLFKSLREEFAQEFWQVRSDLARGIAVTAQQAAQAAADRPADMSDLHQEVADAMKLAWASDRFLRERPPDKATLGSLRHGRDSPGNVLRMQPAEKTAAMIRAAPAMPPAPPQMDTDSPRLEVFPWKD